MAIMEHVNGTGRRVPPLPAHTFKDSGITIRIRKVGPTTQMRFAQAIQREYPKPEAPIVQTEAGPEANPADPAYLEAIDEWGQLQWKVLNDRMLTFAALEAEIEIGPEEQKEIARKRRHLTLTGLTTEENEDMTQEERDKVFYILQVACATPDDLREFGQAVQQRSTPTEEAVQRHLATFPSDVSRPGSDDNSGDTAIGDTV